MYSVTVLKTLPVRIHLFVYPRVLVSKIFHVSILNEITVIEYDLNLVDVFTNFDEYILHVALDFEFSQYFLV